MEELDLKQTRRIDTMQGELVELQKHLASPNPSRPQSLSGSPVSNGRLYQEPNFDIVLGGWKDGVSKEWVEVQVGKLLDSCALRGAVAEVKTFGKKPMYAKLELKAEPGLTLAQLREHQLKVVKQLKEAKWASHDRPVWITMDKSPPQRKVSK